MNPVAISIDTRGRIWIVDSHPLSGGVLDIRYSATSISWLVKRIWPGRP